MTTHDHLEAVVDRLSAEWDVAAVWLFGSEATGRSTRQSDIDLGIVHTYEQSDPRIVDGIVSHHLDELRQLAAHVLTTFDITA